MLGLPAILMLSCDSWLKSGSLEQQEHLTHLQRNDPKLLHGSKVLTGIPFFDLKTAAIIPPNRLLDGVETIFIRSRQRSAIRASTARNCPRFQPAFATPLLTPTPL